jgi:hypothetical protein
MTLSTFISKTTATMVRRISLSAFALLLCSSASFAASKEKEAASMIERAKQLSDIRTEGAPPFRLKMTFRAFREDGSAVEGTYTETWASKNRWRRETVAGDFRRTEVSADGTRLLLESGKGLPEPSHDLPALANVGRLHPESWKPEQIANRQLSGSNLRCVETAGGVRPGPHLSLEREHQNEAEMPALCFDSHSGLLAAEIEPFFLVDHVVNAGCFFYDYEKFGDRAVPRSYQCMKPGHPTLEAKIVELSAEPKADPAMFTLANGIKEKNNCADPIKPPKVVYEAVAIPKGTGIVTVSTIVGIDGATSNLTVVDAAYQQLREPVLEAVSRWRFRPATCDGEPVEGHIQVQVNLQVR